MRWRRQRGEQISTISCKDNMDVGINERILFFSHHFTISAINSRGIGLLYDLFKNEKKCIIGVVSD